MQLTDDEKLVLGEVLRRESQRLGAIIDGKEDQFWKDKAASRQEVIYDLLDKFAKE